MYKSMAPKSNSNYNRIDSNNKDKDNNFSNNTNNVYADDINVEMVGGINQDGGINRTTINIVLVNHMRRAL